MVATLRDEGSWMTEEALGQYNEYLRVAEELGTAKGKGKQCGKLANSTAVLAIL